MPFVNIDTNPRPTTCAICLNMGGSGTGYGPCSCGRPWQPGCNREPTPTGWTKLGDITNQP